MAEQLDLTTPVTPPTLAYWRVFRIDLNRGLIPDSAEVVITLRGTNGEFLSKQYTGIVALTLLTALNTANLTVKSLERRVLERLVADGVLSGTIVGSPD